MSNHFLHKLTRYIPLWQRRIPDYPLYVKGNPQLRIFLPLFWMKMLNWQEALPKDTKVFEVHHQMTEFDVKNYLEKIYNVQVLHVRTQLTRDKPILHPRYGFKLMPGRDKRLAFVQLGGEMASFEFPKIFEGNSPEEKKVKELEDGIKQLKTENEKDWKLKDLPFWFRN